MDYRICKKTSELKGNGYIEIGPGKFSGKHWQDGFLFIREEKFGVMAEGIIINHLPEYDHFNWNNIPKDVGRKITTEWRNVSDQLNHMTIDNVQSSLNMPTWYGRGRLEKEFVAHKAEIIEMLRELAERCDEFYDREDWICILGV